MFATTVMYIVVLFCIKDSFSLQFGQTHRSRNSFRITSTRHLMSAGDGGLSNGQDIWTSRRKIARSTLKPILKGKLEKRQQQSLTPVIVSDQNSGEDVMDQKKKKKKPVGLIISAFLIAITAAVLRLGGRAGFISFLGLDFIADSNIKNQVSDFVTYFQTIDGTVQLAVFFLAWLGAKAFCVDFFTVILAFSSGVLFGGILQGTAVSVACSSGASLCVFLLARYFLREQTEKEIQRRPAFRAVERAVAREGFKTVFTLRLSPLLPIPIAAYNYLYGVTSVSALDFLAGISLGSIKPYLLDSYLGLFGKSLIDDPSGGGMYSDVVLFAFISVLILVGTFATEVATSTWEEIQTENEEEEKKKKEADAILWGDQGPPVISDDNSMGEPKLTDGMAALSDSQFFRMMGVTPNDVDKLPGWVKGIVGDVFAAQNRIESVITDELNAIEYELLEGIDVGWDCTPRKGIALKEGVLLMNDTTGVANVAPIIDGVAHLKYSYPGERNIRNFETVIPDASNIKEYTYESLVFSFALMGAAAKLLDNDEQDDDVMKQTVLTSSPVAAAVK